MRRACYESGGASPPSTTSLPELSPSSSVNGVQAELTEMSAQLSGWEGGLAPAALRDNQV
jgi:hypothetical protein